MSKYNIKFKSNDAAIDKAAEMNKANNLEKKIFDFLMTKYYAVHFEYGIKQVQQADGEYVKITERQRMFFTVDEEHAKRSYPSSFKFVLIVDKQMVYKQDAGNIGVDYEPLDNKELEFFDRLGYDLAPNHQKYTEQDITDWYGKEDEI
jgi:hypothetical protein